MSLNIGEVIRKGFSDAFSRTGLELIALLFILQAAVRVSAVSGVSTNYALLVGAITVISAVIGVLVTIGTIRLFHRQETDGITSVNVFTDGALMKFLNLLIGGIVFGIAVAAGFILLIVPGLILLTGLIFWQIYVVIEDQNFFEAMKSSWGDTYGQKWDLFLLGVLMTFITLVISVTFSIPGTIMSLFSPVVGSLLTSIGGAITSVLTIAALIEAFQQTVE